MTQQANIQLNQDIIAAHTESVILTLLEERMEDFNIVNCATALHRYAKLSRSRTLPTILHTLLAHSTALVQENPKACQPRHLANFLWACAQLGLRDEEFERAVLGVVQQKLKWFKPQELSNLLWALAKLKVTEEKKGGRKGGTREGEVWEGEEGDPETEQLLQDISWYIVQSISEFTPQGLANTCWSYATLNYYHTETMDSVISAVGTRVAEFNAQEISNILWALAKLQVKTFTFLEKARGTLVKNIPEFKEQHVANIFWALAKFADEDSGIDMAVVDSIVANFYRTVRTRAQKFNNQELCMIIWAISVLGMDCRETRKERGTGGGEGRGRGEGRMPILEDERLGGGRREGTEAAMALLATCKTRVAQFSGQQLAIVSLGFAKLGIREEELLSGLAKRSAVCT
jgi:hypothetical protein